MWEEHLGVSFQHDHLLWARTAHIMLQLQWYDFRWEKGKKNNIFILAQLADRQLFPLYRN